MKIISNLQSRPLLCAAAGLLTIVMAAGGTRPAAAQASDAADRCTPDVMRLCSEFVPDEGRIVACLKSKRKQLTSSCLNALQPQGSGKARKRRAKHSG